MLVLAARAWSVPQANQAHLRPSNPRRIAVCASLALASWLLLSHRLLELSQQQNRLITLAGGSLGWQVLARRVFGLVAVVAAPPSPPSPPSQRSACDSAPTSKADRVAAEPPRATAESRRAALASHSESQPSRPEP